MRILLPHTGGPEIKERSQAVDGRDERYTEEDCGCQYDETAGRYVRFCDEHDPSKRRERLRQKENRIRRELFGLKRRNAHA